MWVHDSLMCIRLKEPPEGMGAAKDQKSPGANHK